MGLQLDQSKIMYYEPAVEIVLTCSNFKPSLIELEFPGKS